MKKKTKRIILFGVLITIFILLRYLDIGQYLTIESLKLHGIHLKQQIKSNYLLGVALYILFYVLCSAFALPATFVITIAGGYFFGVFPGVLYVLIGATLGAAGAFLAARYLIGSFVQKRYGRRLQTINQELAQRGVFYLLSIRLILVLPFFVVNLLLGLTEISLFEFMWTTAVGIIPASILFTFAGKQLKRVQTVYDIFTPQTIVVFLGIALILLLPVIVRFVRKKKSAESSAT